MDGRGLRELHPTDPSAVRPGTVLVTIGDTDNDVYARAYFGPDTFSEDGLKDYLGRASVPPSDKSWPSRAAAGYVAEAKPEGLWHTDTSSAYMTNPERRFYVRMHPVSGQMDLREYPAPYGVVREPRAEEKREDEAS